MCAHIPAIKGCSSPSHIWNVVEKTKEISRKPKNINWIVSQTPTPEPKHNEIWAQWALDIPSESMLEKVWWCKCFKMKFWSWTICCPMNYSNERKHAQTKSSRRSHVSLRCCWKRKVLLSTHVKASRRKGCWSTVNLKTMIEATKA